MFATPGPCWLLESYAAANVLAAQIIGKKISQQAWALRHNIARVAAAGEGDSRIIEVHPEVSFRADRRPRAVCEVHLERPAMRRAALANAGIDLPADLGAAGVAPSPTSSTPPSQRGVRSAIPTAARPRLPEDAPRGQRGVIWY